MNLEPAKIGVLYYQPQKISLNVFHEKLNCVFENRWFTNSGPMETELAAAIAKLHDVKHCVLLANATLALQLTARALELKGQVITTPFSFVATTQSLRWEGLTPLYVDIEPDYWNMSPSAVSAAIQHNNSDVCGILAVHVFGIPCQATEIDEIAAKANLLTFYDAAHCFGVKLNGKSIGSFGKAEILSFHATKIFHTFEGGAVLTNDSALARKIEKMRNFGFAGLDTIDSHGINAKMNEISAAYGLSMLPHMEVTVSTLSKIHLRYRSRLNGIEGISFAPLAPGLESNFQYCPILVDAQAFGLSRNEVWAALWAKGIQTRRYFYPMLSEIHFPAANNITSQPRLPHLPNAKRVTNSVLCLPCYVDLAEESIDEVAKQIAALRDDCQAIRKWYFNFLQTPPPAGSLLNVHKALSRGQSSVS